MKNTDEILFINVIHTIKGKLEEFAKLQINDFATYGSALDGSISNEFYVSVNEGGEGHCVNIAKFKDLESYYLGTSTETFKKHIERIKPLLVGTQPMLLKKVWDSSAPEQKYDSQASQVNQLMNQDQGLQQKYQAPRIQTH